jgi:hypothetical protein
MVGELKMENSNYTYLFNVAGLSFYEGPNGDEDPVYIKYFGEFIETDWFDKPSPDEVRDFKNDLDYVSIERDN